MRKEYVIILTQRILRCIFQVIIIHIEKEMAIAEIYSFEEKNISLNGNLLTIENVDVDEGIAVLLK